ncbi:MAG: antitoxin family protein [Phycisphaerae bacterium]|nr:antitoxin family protein [Phycisphaerae bacterium]
MTKVIEAIYSNGVLKPVEALELPEQQRVRLIVQVIAADRRRAREEAFKRLRERIARSKFSYGGPLPTRDELHERF